MKRCSICGSEKDFCDFHKWKYGTDGYKRECKVCRKKETKYYYEKKHVEVKKRVKIYREKNSDIVNKKRMKRYYENKESESKYMSNYRRKNRKKLNEQNTLRKKSDPLYSLKHKMNSRLRMFLKSKNMIKKNRTFSIIGCNPEELKVYLQTKFKDGMSWENQGSWHIDHIIPLSSAQNEEEIYKLCHFTNLQPLWAEENLRKGNKLISNT